MVATLTEPVADRRSSLDALRGVALFGVVIMNVTSFVIVPQLPAILESETVAGFATSFAALVVIGGKARSIFALLFGIGFAILLSRAEEKGGDFSAFYRRRLGLLLIIGILNMLFVYWGDILIMYALLGFVLMSFRRASTELVLALGITFAIVPSLIKGAVLLVFGDVLPTFSIIPPLTAEPYLTGDLAAYVQANINGYLVRYVNEPITMVIYAFHVLGMFLLGLWCVRKGMVTDITPYRPLLRRLFWFGLLPGLVVGGFFFVSYVAEPGLAGPFKAFVYAAYVGIPLLSVSYASGLMLLFTGDGRIGGALRSAFAPAGRMALTGYLGASALAGFVVNGWGLGTLESWSMLTGHFLSVAIFVAIAVFSAVWLRAFRFGPMEWLWRTFTYGRAQPFLRAKARAVATPWG